MENSYAQNNEDYMAFNYLHSIGVHDPVVLDIGANDGKTFSNSRLFSKRGSVVHLVEPSETALIKLRNEYSQDDPKKYFIYPYAIGKTGESGKRKFQESGTLLNKDDVALVSTFSQEEMARWGPTMQYKEIEVDVITMAELLDKVGTKKLDFITIDVEGGNLDVLKQIDFRQLTTRIVCVENNGLHEGLFWSWMIQYKFRLFTKNGENLIFTR